MIAALVQAVTFAIRAIDPVLHQVLGIYLPLITTNCAVLGVALLASNRHLSLFATIALRARRRVRFHAGDHDVRGAARTAR